MTMQSLTSLSPLPLAGEGARAKRGRERGVGLEGRPTPNSRYALATLSRYAGEGKGA
jgi:hypothetical protein